MSNYFPLWPHVDSHLLDPPLRARVDQKDWLPIGNSAREQATRRNDSSLRVYNNIRDRHEDRALVVAFDHRLAVLAIGVPVPDFGNPVDLSLVRRGHHLHRHSQNGLVDW